MGLTGDYQGIIMHGGYNIDTYALYINSDIKNIGFKTTGTSNGWINVDNDELWDGNWHLLTVTYNGSQKVIYLDKEAIHTVEATGPMDSGEGFNLFIGAGRDKTIPTLLYNGLIDEVRIYNYALTSEQIGEFYELYCPQHFHTVWEGTFGQDHMNINVFDAKLDGIDLEPGDEIGVFDGDLCVGFGKLEQTIDLQNILVIKVSRDDGSGNGYTTENEITYRVWDCSTSTEYSGIYVQCFDSQSNPVSCPGYEAGGTAFVNLSVLGEICVTLNFKTGWNIFSYPGIPQETDLINFTQLLIDNSSLVKIQDEEGSSLEDWGVYGGWQNNIGDISPTEGYKIKVSGDDVLEWCGSKILYPFEIPLKTGWNIISFPKTESVFGTDVVQPLIDNNTLVKVQDEAGNSIEDWGVYGGWQNNIGNFSPGKGFKVKVDANVSLWIDENYPKSATIHPESEATIHYIPTFNGNGVDHMNFNLIGLSEEILQEGDEIAVFDGVNCVGSARLSRYYTILTA